MTIIEMLEQSLLLTVLGMAIVFVFLWFMAFMIYIVGKLIKIKERPVVVPKVQNEFTKKPDNIVPEHIAAISSAVIEFKKEETH